MTPVVELAGVTKDYRALRPLRIERLVVSAAERVALLGLDAAGAETLLNLVTGAAVPDRGVVSVFGRTTASIADSADWLAVVDRFGIVSERAVLLEGLSVVQNLALPFTISIEPPPAPVRERAEALAAEVGLPTTAFNARVSDLDGATRARIRLGRALALGPDVLLLEHASASLSRNDANAFGADTAQIAARRGAALIAVTADPEFAKTVAERVLTVNPANGVLTATRRGWFARGRS